MALNDIKVLQEQADGSLKEILLTPTDIGAIADAPLNGTLYARQDGAWTPTSETSTFQGQNELAIFSGSEYGGSLPKGSLLAYSNGNHTPTFSSFPSYTCNPIILIGGSALTSLSFSNISNNYDSFSLPDTSGLTALTSLSFSSIAQYADFTLSDTSGLTALTTLSFSSCGYLGNFYLPDTSGLTALTSLSFNYCANYSQFTLSDTSGLTALTTLSFSSCGYYNTFTLSDTSGLTALTSLSFNYCGGSTFSIVDSISLLPEAKALIILNAVDNGDSLGIGPITLKVTGTSTLQTVKTSLEGKGYTVTLTTP
jgi:hypothetical protein